MWTEFCPPPMPTNFLTRNIWLIIGLLLFGWIIRDIEWGPTWEAFSRLRLWQIAVLIVVNFFVLMTLYGRWWIVLRGMGVDVPFRAVSRYTLAGFAISFLTPGPQFGGEPYQIAALKRRHAISLPLGSGSVAVEKMIGLFTDIAFLGLCLLFVTQTGSASLVQSFSTDQTFLFGLVIGWIVLFFTSLMFFWRRARHPLTRAISWALPTGRPWGQRLASGLRQTEEEIITLCNNRPQTLLLSLLFSIASWLLFGLEFLLTAAFIGIPLTPLLAVLLITAFRLAFLLPIPGGLGTVEAGQLWVLTAMAVPQAGALAISFSLLIHLRDLIVVALGLWFLRRERSVS